MSLTDEFTKTEAYAALTRNIYRDATEAPSVGLMKARLAEMLDALLMPKEPEAKILFNLFDELYSLDRFGDDEPHWNLLVFAELAREMAYAYTDHFHNSLEAFSQSEKDGA